MEVIIYKNYMHYILQQSLKGPNRPELLKINIHHAPD
jgi:hypothetical protein